MGKYNLKNIMLGIGIGLVIASMANINKERGQLTVGEIKREAEKHDLIVISIEDIIDKQKTKESPSEKAVTPTPAPTSDPEPAPAQEQTIDPQKKVVSIESGMTSEQIADLLADKGLINEAKEFSKRVGELHVEHMLKVGNYEITKGMGIDEIIMILTK